MIKLNSNNNRIILYDQNNIKISLVYDQELEHGTTYYFHISLIKDQKLLNQEIEPFEFYPILRDLLGKEDTEQVWKRIKLDIIKTLKIKSGNLTKFTVDHNKKTFKIIEYPNCALCQEAKELKKSHIIPRFIAKWIKKTSETGKFRDLEYKRIQDSVKSYLLCDDCENIISKYENYFAEKIFHPTVNMTSCDVEYDIKLLKFIVSISWRVLKVILYNKKQNSEEIIPDLIKIEQNWRYFLEDRSIEVSTSHYLVHTVCDLNFKEDYKKSWKKFTERAIGFGYDSYDDVDFIWCQIPYYFIISPINPSKLYGYESCEIQKEGVYKEFTAVNLEKFDFMDFIFSKLNQFNKEIRNSESYKKNNIE